MIVIPSEEFHDSSREYNEFSFVDDVEGGAEEVGVGDGVAGVFLLLQGPGGLGAFDLLEVGDAGTFLAGGARLDEVGDRDGRQESDDGHYDHDFHEGEAGFVCLADFHFSTFYLSYCGVNASEADDGL